MDINITSQLSMSGLWAKAKATAILPALPTTSKQLETQGSAQSPPKQKTSWLEDHDENLDKARGSARNSHKGRSASESRLEKPSSSRRRNVNQLEIDAMATVQEASMDSRMLDLIPLFLSQHIRPIPADLD
jgi:hypothetical protein